MVDIKSGGICGRTGKVTGSTKNSTIQNCYNLGEISSNTGVSGQSGNFGGIIGQLAKDSEVKYCYNLGTIKHTGWAANVGGIAGICVETSKVSECYNIADVESQYYSVGGLCGALDSTTCSFQNCYISKNAIVKYKGIEIIIEIGIQNPIGNSYLGRLLGRSASANCYSNLGQKEASEMPTVYNVLNEFSEIDSEIWDKTEPNAPKLLWELEKNAQLP